MQIKTIQKTVSNKMTEWLDTVKDEGLRSDLKSNLLVSGGAIASMLLNEDVNDFDVYIKDPKVLMRLVEYYTKDFAGITILSGTDRDKLIKQHEEVNALAISDISNSYAVAIRNLKPDQIKLFFNSANKGGLKVNVDKKEEDLKYDPMFFSPNAISLSNKIQIVIRFYGDDVAIHRTFDFIHATNFFTFDSGLVTNKEALESLLTKQLRYQGSSYPLTSIIRMKKFIKRNWNINAGEMLKIMFQISDLDLRDPDVLEEQLIGVDVAYFGTLIEILRDVKEEKITSGYLNAIIDKVFNNFDGVE